VLCTSNVACLLLQAQWGIAQAQKPRPYASTVTAQSSQPGASNEADADVSKSAQLTAVGETHLACADDGGVGVAADRQVSEAAAAEAHAAIDCQLVASVSQHSASKGTERIAPTAEPAHDCQHQSDRHTVAPPDADATTTLQRGAAGCKAPEEQGQPARKADAARAASGDAECSLEPELQDGDVGIATQAAAAQAGSACPGRSQHFADEPPAAAAQPDTSADADEVDRADAHDAPGADRQSDDGTGADEDQDDEADDSGGEEQQDDSEANSGAELEDDIAVAEAADSEEEEGGQGGGEDEEAALERALLAERSLRAKKGAAAHLTPLTTWLRHDCSQVSCVGLASLALSDSTHTMLRCFMHSDARKDSICVHAVRALISNRGYRRNAYRPPAQERVLRGGGGPE
jgi:hypothetical protein